ncbi:hypothetical protein [Mycolicibacterium sp. XJ879]
MELIGLGRQLAARAFEQCGADTYRSRYRARVIPELFGHNISAANRFFPGILCSFRPPARTAGDVHARHRGPCRGASGTDDAPSVSGFQLSMSSG